MELVMEPVLVMATVVATVTALDLAQDPHHQNP